MTLQLGACQTYDICGMTALDIVHVVAAVLEYLSDFLAEVARPAQDIDRLVLREL